jgi:hypothetical protein
MIKKYDKYRIKYFELNHQIGGKTICCKIKENIILFPDILTNEQYPEYFIDKIQNNYNIIYAEYKFHQQKFNLSDLIFENIAKYVYNLIDPSKKYIVFGLNQGCVLASYFSNTYNNNVTMLFLINNRRINKKNYEKSVIRGERMLEIEYDKDTANKYKYGIQTDNDLHNKIKNKKYIILIQGTIMLKIRSQYAKAPVKQNVKTYIFDQMVTDTNIIKKHNLKDSKTRKIKDLHTINQAILDHYKTNMDKIIQNNNIINSSKYGLVTVDYELNILGKNNIITKNRMKKIMHILNNINLDRPNILLIHSPNIFQTKEEILKKNNKIIDKLEKLGILHHYFFPYYYTNNKLKLKDYKFDSVAKDIHKKFKYMNNLTIVCLEHASPYGLTFANKYPELCKSIICYPLRFYHKKSLERRIWKYRNNKGWEKYIGTGYDFNDYYLHINDTRLKELLDLPQKTDKEKEFKSVLLYHIFDYQLMKQHKQVPQIFKNKTYIFTRLELDLESIIKENFDRKAIREMKAFIKKDDALFGAIAWIIDRIKYDKELMKKNKNLTIQHYIGGESLTNDDLLINSVKIYI